MERRVAFTFAAAFVRWALLALYVAGMCILVVGYVGEVVTSGHDAGRLFNLLVAMIGTQAIFLFAGGHVEPTRERKVSRPHVGVSIVTAATVSVAPMWCYVPKGMRFATFSVPIPSIQHLAWLWLPTAFLFCLLAAKGNRLAILPRLTAGVCGVQLLLLPASIIAYLRPAEPVSPGTWFPELRFEESFAIFGEALVLLWCVGTTAAILFLRHRARRHGVAGG
ncbi:MAG: hypothetical protein HY719_01605 [Planctomycetes bacterium]|nr:hypothetical protein [Planctomycetota bacterium]